MKVAIEYSGFLRFVQTTVPLLNTFFIADEPIEFYLFFHTWNDVCEYKPFSSSNEDIEFMKQHAHDYYIDSQKEKHFEVHPYQLINSDMTHEEFMNDPRREKWFASHPSITNTQSKNFFEKPSPGNGFHFDKSLRLVSLEYDHECVPYNMNCYFYSVHQASLIANHYSQKNNIDFDFFVRMRTDIIIENPINLSHLNKDVITMCSVNINGSYGRNLALGNSVAIGNKELMTKCNDLFIYLPAYYFIFKINCVPEFFLGFHLRYQRIPFETSTALNNHIIRYSKDEYCIKTS